MQPGSGRARVRSGRGDEGRFFAGLIALVGITVFATLAIAAVLPVAIPGAYSASITSGSMMPKLRAGDVVIAIDSGDVVIAIGTVVVFEDPRAGGLVTHRVVAITPDGTYVRKGDGNGTADPAPVAPENVLGVGHWVVPYAGFPSVWLGEGRWILLALTVGAITGGVWMAGHAVDVRHDLWVDAAGPVARITSQGRS